MAENPKPFCPECVEQPEALDRRGFIRVVGERTAALAAIGSLAAGIPATRVFAAQEPAAKRAAKPAEELIRELYTGLSAEQKSNAVMAWDHVDKGGSTPMRLRMYNRALAKPIGEVYTKPQQELVERILRSISSGEEGYHKLTREGTFDNSKTLAACGANIFGDPTNGQKYSWVFSGHHLTVRCDGNSEEGAAFGGPMYYGHSPNGYSDKNCFYYQTKRVLDVYDALTPEQRKKATVKGSPGEGEGSIKFRKGEMPGIRHADLTEDQRILIERVMRDILSPYRKEDADEVMTIVKANGGMQQIHLAFYEDMAMNDREPWHFWRLEGPGFVWNYRVLPHVHTYVNIASRAT